MSFAVKEQLIKDIEELLEFIKYNDVEHYMVVAVPDTLNVQGKYCFSFGYTNDKQELLIALQDLLEEMTEENPKVKDLLDKIIQNSKKH